MKNTNLPNKNSWVILAMFHKNQVKKVKEKTGATHVIHIRNYDGDKNCLQIKKGDKQIKFGSALDFNEWTETDYNNAINEFNKSERNLQ
jgi:hypothetical protein